MCPVVSTVFLILPKVFDEMIDRTMEETDLHRSVSDRPYVVPRDKTMSMSCYKIPCESLTFSRTYTKYET